MTDVRRDLLVQQLGIMWGFAQEFVLDRIDEDTCLWEPSTNVCTVRRIGERWVADWPDESRNPLPEVTVAWLLWHMEWWWTQTLRSVDGLPVVPAEEHEWSGGVQGLVAAKAAWDEVLETADLEREVRGLHPEPRPLWAVAAWVSVELTKNLAELHQVLVRRANVVALPDVGGAL